MESSLEYRLPLGPSRRWIREAPAKARAEGPQISYKLLLAFILFLYSNIAVLYRSLDALRLGALIAGAAICIMIVEIGQARSRFRLSWPQGILLLAFLCVAFVSSFDAMWVRLAFERTSDITKIVLIYILIENTVTTEHRLRQVFFTMFCCGTIPALGTIYYYFNGVLLEGSRAAWKGTFGNPNEAAYGLLILLPLALTVGVKSGWFVRVLLLGMTAVYLLAIFLTFSRGGLLGLLAVIALIGWKQKSIVLRALLVLGLLGAVFVGSLYWHRSQSFKEISEDTTFNQRIATIQAGINMFEAFPLLGVGPGCSIVAYPLYVPAEAHCGCQLQLVIHNSFIQVLSELGILGFLTWMLFVGRSLWDAWKMQRGPMAPYAAALEIALWGCMVCGLSGGFVYTWWPYILIALVVAAKHISASNRDDAVAAV